eukprot:CAMPEP_0177767300 /NCGR_PEP_ID=MMETSP0491_2-20121128/9016_1 /TAXON_ID=63592 /ORGANISM="Tetraselmis chuii, Strain PLY429" /LENGTH=93 /DNA_ID=CAMNT_0019283835 /DNA_START=547 /DNA_END=825 /DNA_ORIENTATION=+
MAQKNPPVAPVDSPDPGSQQSTVHNTQGVLELLRVQLTRLDAYLDSRSAAIAALPAAGAISHPPVAQRRHDAHLAHFPEGHHVHTLPLEHPPD